MITSAISAGTWLPRPIRRRSGASSWMCFMSIATGVLGGLALAAKSDRDDALDAFPGNKQTIDSAKRRTTRLATATDVMIGVTAAGAITTLVLFLVNPGSGSSDDEGSDDATQDDALQLSVTPSLDGVWVTGTF